MQEEEINITPLTSLVTSLVSHTGTLSHSAANWRLVGGRGGQQERRGPDGLVQVEVGLEDMYTGKYLEVSTVSQVSSSELTSALVVLGTT